ncbi:hypothetical protein [Bradyrhizobium sp. 145]|uniref:hypothetical protein n=1 Tax=Bradyrhizobium sp. 145 TaxID=2782621 RepID=UPI001FFBA9DB|nr:hypothetical protein [Bradyrhizobium sp. 145]MCK1684666.1 hypothetical protein [Bradyrhizobium sp. 145]
MTTQDSEQFIEPNWEVLKLLMLQAMNWMWRSDASDHYGPAELESLTMAYNVLFNSPTIDDKLKQIAFRVSYIDDFSCHTGPSLKEMITWPREKLST